VEIGGKKNAQLTGIRQSTVPSSWNQEARLKNESVTRKSKENNNEKNCQREFA